MTAALLRPVLWAVMMASLHHALVLPPTPVPAVTASSLAVTVAAPGWYPDTGPSSDGDGPQPDTGPSVTYPVQPGYSVTTGPDDATTPQPAYQCNAADAQIFVWCSNFDGAW